MITAIESESYLLQAKTPSSRRYYCCKEDTVVVSYENIYCGTTAEGNKEPFHHFLFSTLYNINILLYPVIFQECLAGWKELSIPCVYPSTLENPR